MKGYTVSFCSSGEHRPAQQQTSIPQLVFKTHLKELPGIQQRLKVLAKRSEEAVASYLDTWNTPPPFIHFQKNLFEMVEFGYGGCGVLTKGCDLAQFIFEIHSGRAVNNTVGTIQSLLRALKAHEDQPLQLETSIGTSGMNSDHAIGGYIHNRVFEGLRMYHALSVTNIFAPLPAHVLYTMRAAQSPFSHTNDGIYGSICGDGMFLIGCQGDATQIYSEPGMEYGEISAHNVDHPWQQIVLIAGLVQLCEFAEKWKNTQDR